MVEYIDIIRVVIIAFIITVILGPIIIPILKSLTSVKM